MKQPTCRCFTGISFELSTIRKDDVTDGALQYDIGRRKIPCPRLLQHRKHGRRQREPCMSALTTTSAARPSCRRCRTVRAFPCGERSFQQLVRACLRQSHTPTPPTSCSATARCITINYAVRSGNLSPARHPQRTATVDILESLGPEVDARYRRGSGHRSIPRSQGLRCRERPPCRSARFGTARRPFPTEQSGQVLPGVEPCRLLDLTVQIAQTPPSCAA